MPKLQTNKGSALSDDDRWRAVESRDRSYDNVFVYAVLSTRVYCRPWCPSRRPERGRVIFFARPAAAERSGFRPCKRCRPQGGGEAGARWVPEACRYIESHLDGPLGLQELAGRFGVSRFAFQRAFKRSTGVTPREYADACRLKLVRTRLRAGHRVADALYEAGYGSSSRLYERASAHFGMTPAIYRQGGQGMEIHYALAESRLGWVLVAATERGVCSVRMGDSAKELERGLAAEFPRAAINGAGSKLSQWVREVVGHLDGAHPQLEIPVDVRATAFQRRVWDELRRIPYGSTRSYQEIARAIHKPRAVRAVGHACATNPVAVIVPCHRVVRSDGDLGGYRWGLGRKQALLANERARLRGKEGAKHAGENDG